MSQPFVDFYLVLGIAPSATASEIDSAFRSLARKHHPDSSTTQTESTDEFKAVAEAYDTLSDPLSRRAYDWRRARYASQESAQPRREPSFPRTPGGPDKPAVCDMHGQVGEWDVFAELPIAPEEARDGARIDLTLTASLRCDQCAGSGCVSCGGWGSLQQRRQLNVQLPRGIRDGTVLHVPHENVALQVRIRPYW